MFLVILNLLTFLHNMRGERQKERKTNTERQNNRKTEKQKERERMKERKTETEQHKDRKKGKNPWSSG